jgi:hypothetical protein
VRPRDQRRVHDRARLALTVRSPLRPAVPSATIGPPAPIGGVRVEERCP